MNDAISTLEGSRAAEPAVFRPSWRASIAVFAAAAVFPIIFGTAALLAGPTTADGQQALRGVLATGWLLLVAAPLVLRPLTVRLEIAEKALCLRTLWGTRRRLSFHAGMEVRCWFSFIKYQSYLSDLSATGGYEGALPSHWSSTESEPEGEGRRAGDLLASLFIPSEHAADARPHVLRMAFTDGRKTATIPLDLVPRKELHQRLWEVERTFVLPSARTRIAHGDTVKFGDVALSAHALFIGDKRMALEDLGGITVGYRHVRFLFSDGPVDVRVKRVRNLQTLLTLLDEMMMEPEA